jgi:hypothetical protein
VGAHASSPDRQKISGTTIGSQPNRTGLVVLPRPSERWQPPVGIDTWPQNALGRLHLGEDVPARLALVLPRSNRVLTFRRILHA